MTRRGRSEGERAGVGRRRGARGEARGGRGGATSVPGPVSYGAGVRFDRPDRLEGRSLRLRLSLSVNCWRLPPNFCLPHTRACLLRPAGVAGSFSSPPPPSPGLVAFFALPPPGLLGNTVGLFFCPALSAPQSLGFRFGFACANCRLLRIFHVFVTVRVAARRRTGQDEPSLRFWVETVTGFLGSREGRTIGPDLEPVRSVA